MRKNENQDGLLYSLACSHFIKYNYFNDDNFFVMLIIHTGDALKSMEPLKAGKWKKYLDLKAAFYQSYVS